MSRKFKLIDGSGAELDLCSTSHYFNAPDGLGFDRNLSSMQIGSAFVLVEDNLNQQTISGEMVFKSYGEYQEFSRFVKTDVLTLVYQPIDGGEWYYRTCKVKNLGKGEISHTTHRLHCNVDFLCFSQWYESDTVGRTAVDDSEILKFPLPLPMTFFDVNVNQIEINNGNVEPAPCKIEINGPCINPAWSLVQGDETVSTGAVNIEIAAGEKLIVDSNIETMRIELVNSAGTVFNAYQHSDFTTERFVYAPSGKSTLYFTHTKTTALNVSVEVRQLADTV